MSTQLVETTQGMAIERALIVGDLSQLKPEERLAFYKRICESVGLNPLTKPLEYITLNGKLTLYARKDATDQLRNINQVSVTISAREVVEDCYVVTARATTPNGRTDESIGAVPIANLKGEAKCNALMKCETKAKRRVTLSICGLGMLDESEIESIPNAKVGEQAVVVKETPISFKRESAPKNSTVVQDQAKVETVPQEGKLVERNGADQVRHAVIAGPPYPSGPNATERAATSAMQVERHGDKVSTAVAPKVQDAPSILSGQDRPAVEYISVKQQAEFHAACRGTVPKDDIKARSKVDGHTYQWLLDQGYVNAKGEPSAKEIPASHWPKARDKAARWVSVQ